MTAPIPDDLVTDEALTLLGKVSEGRLYYECPGCFAEVHHSDRTAHARECPELRSLARARVSEGGAK